MLKKSSCHPVTLAFAANYPDSALRNQWALENSSALQYSPDPRHPELIPQKVSAFIEAGIPVRFHTRYFDYEIGSADQDLAETALKKHIETLKYIQGLGEPVVTVHTGLNRQLPVREELIVANLSRLVEYASRLGIVVCLENLRQGHASDPYKVYEWARSSGAMLTLDLGHARGCPVVQSGLAALPEIAELFSPLLGEVHIYGKEDHQGHHPIQDINPLKETLEKLLETDCRWWTIELAEPEQALSTRNLIQNFFESSPVLHKDMHHMNRGITFPG